MGKGSIIALCSILVACGVFIAMLQEDTAEDLTSTSVKTRVSSEHAGTTRKLVKHIKTAFKKAEHHWDEEGVVHHHNEAKEEAKEKTKTTVAKGGRKMADQSVLKDKAKKAVKKAMKKYVKTKNRVVNKVKKAIWHSLRRRRTKSISRRRRRRSSSRRRRRSRRNGKVISVKKKVDKNHIYKEIIAKKAERAKAKKAKKPKKHSGTKQKQMMKKILKMVHENKLKNAGPKPLWKGLKPGGKINQKVIVRDLVSAKQLSDPYHCDEETEETQGKDCIHHPGHINSKGKDINTGGVRGLPKKYPNGKVRPPGYTTHDAHLGPSGHYYIGVARRRIGAGFGRRRRTLAPPRHRSTSTRSRILVHGGVTKKGVAGWKAGHKKQ